MNNIIENDKIALLRWFIDDPTETILDSAPEELINSYNKLELLSTAIIEHPDYKVEL